MYDRNVSPVGWYVGSYLIRFTEIDDKNKHELERRFLTWENTVIVKAKNMNEAYKKIVKIAKTSTAPYRGEGTGVPVQWVYEGVTELLPIYEDMEDGAEIMWAEHAPSKLKNIRKRVKSLDDFKQ